MTMQEPQRGRGEEGLPCRVGDDCLGDFDSVMLVTVVPMMTMNYIADSAKGGEAKGYRLCGGNAEQLQSSWDLDRAERRGETNLDDEVRGRSSVEAESRRWIDWGVVALRWRVLSTLFFLTLLLLS